MNFNCIMRYGNDLGRQMEDLQTRQQSDKWKLSPQKQMSLIFPSFLYYKDKVGEMDLRFSRLMSALQGCPDIQKY